jgi:hypothetical protein
MRTNSTTQETEIITPEMIEAGFRVLAASGITDDPLEADRLLVAEIFRAMVSCRLPALGSDRR